MVIQHNHIRAFGCGDRAMRQGATIDTDDQIVIRRQRRHGLFVGAIPLINPVRHIKRRIMAHLAQPDQQQCGRAAAIDIIIGKDRNLFAVLQG